MIEASFIVLEDATRDLAAAQEIYEGMPLSLDATGKLIAATSATKVYGLAKVPANEYQNYATGEFGAYGTGKLTVMCGGIARIMATTHNKVEIGTDPAAVVFKKQIYAEAANFVAGDPLYVDADGYISNVAVSTTSFLGRVVTAPVDNGWMEIELIKAPTVAELGAVAV
jgi:hypothetical protein